jgi:Ca-activated chloride channel family protein
MGLEQQDFALYEDGKRQQIQFFSAEDAPISVGLLLDFSHSMKDKFDDEREAVRQFFANADPKDDYFAVSFANRPEVLADATQSEGDIQAALANVTPKGYTALLDAVYLGISKLRSARHQRRALLIISDGGDNVSRYSLKETKKMAEEADVSIYAIALNPAVPILRPIEERLGQRLLTQITDATGGRTVMVDNAAKLVQAAATISRELRNQYVLGYRPSNQAHDGKFRRLKVQVRASTQVAPIHLYYRKGYIAPVD